MRRLVKFQEGNDRLSSWIGPVGKGLLGLFISAAFIVLALKGVDLDQVLVQLHEVEATMFLPIFLTLILIYLLKAFRWWYLIFPIKSVAFGRILTSTIIGFMANNALPLRGGDLVRAHLLGSGEGKGIGTTAIFTTVALDRVFEVLSLLTVAVLVILMVPLPGWMWNSLIILGIALVGSVMGIVVFRNPPKVLGRWWGSMLIFLPDGLEETLSKFLGQIRIGLEAGNGKLRLVNIYLLAVSETAVNGVLVYLSLKMVGIELSFVVIISVLIAMNLAVLIPAAPANIGVFEFAVMTTLEFFQLNKSIALSGAVILHAISIIPVSVVGFILLVKEWIVPKEGVLK